MPPLDHCRPPKSSCSKWVPYRELVCKLLYLAVATRPDIAYVIGNLCRFVENPGWEHWLAAKRVLKDIVHVELVYSPTVLRTPSPHMPRHSPLLVVDNKAAIQVAKHPEHQSTMKHIHRTYHWIHDHIACDLISVSRVPGDNIPADILTKPFDSRSLSACWAFALRIVWFRGSSLLGRVDCFIVSRLCLLCLMTFVLLFVLFMTFPLLHVFLVQGLISRPRTSF